METSEMNDKRQQVAAQCRAVRHLATELAQLHGDFEGLASGGNLDSLLDSKGKRTAELMELLGDILNGMDAVSEEDAWLDPIFESAQRLWPSGDNCPHCGARRALAAARA